MAYGGFARVYDLFMSDTPYEKWYEFVCAIWESHGQNPRLVLDLACGTGAFTALLARDGRDVIGLDASADMLDAARKKLPNTLLTCQDMRNFELYGTVDAAVCLCDSVNYLTRGGDLARAFALVNNYLNPGGLFIFDVKTPYAYEKILADNTFAATERGAAYVWANSYDPETRVNTYRIDFFAQEANGLYRRFRELHCQRAYTHAEITAALKKAGLVTVSVHDGNGFGNVADTSERVFYVAREHGK